MTIDGRYSKASLQAYGNPLFNYFNEIVPTSFDRLSGSDHYGFYLIALWLLMPLFSGAQRAVVARDRGRRLSEPGNTCGLSIVLDILRLILILESVFLVGDARG